MARTPPVPREQPVELAVELVVRGAVTPDDAAAGPGPTLSAIADLLDLGDEFHLFPHGKVVYLRFDGDYGLVQAP